MEKLQTKGFVAFSEFYLENLLTRKLVAMFTDYEHAKTDILFECMNKWPDQEEGIKRCIDILERETDVLEYWEQLGTNKKRHEAE